VAALEDRCTFEALRPTTQALALRGVDQLLLAMDAGHEPVETSAASVTAEMRRVSWAGLSIAGRIRALEVEFSRLACERALHAIHLHGVAPCLLGARALKRSPLRGRVLYSVHGMQFGSTWAAGLLGHLLQPQPVDALPHAVSDVLFTVPKAEHVRPTVLAQGSVDVVTRLSVLLNGRGARVRFSWLGGAQNGTAAQLEAANIALLDAGDDRQRALWLSQAWLFVQMSLRDHFPLGVAQAMAAGVPCLVSDVPAHRALIDDGKTGFVCRSERDLLEKIVMLLRNGQERARLGEAARGAARERFTTRHFENAVLRAYGLSGGEQGSGVVH
jgi:hypothetical protein